MKRKTIAVVAAIFLGACLMTGCGSEKEADSTTTTQTETTNTTETTSDTTETTDTSDTTEPAVESDTAEVSDSEEAEEMTPNPDAKEQAIMVVSFGTSYNDSREKTIGAIEKAIEDANPDYDIRRAFTSQIIIDKLKERDGLEIDNVTEALDRAVLDGVKKLVVQPTHLMSGYEYTDLKEELETYTDKFEAVSLAEPLLTSDEDYEAVAKAITTATAEKVDGKTAICFMGHGTEADSDSDYEKLQDTLTKDGYSDYYVGTVEGALTLDDVIQAVKDKGTYTKVVLEPLMVVAGDHANNDMAGDDKDSWKSQFEAAGFEVEPLLQGLGENPDIQNIYVSHTKDAIEKLGK
ncbi:MAG: sirohydrochlorin cobaltochelatase [Lachnospiraceae bacterium]